MPTLPARTQRYLRSLLIVLFIATAIVALMQNTGVMTVASGVSLFIFAMLLLEQGFKMLSGGFLNSFLEKVANKNWKSFLFGFTLSTLAQSSGLVTVIAVSFLSAGLITLASGVAMVLGVNLSAAFTTWIVGYFGLKAKISLYAMPFICVGVGLFLSRNRKIKGCGLFFLSLGLLFLGLSWMKEGFESFKDTIDITQYAVPGILGILLFSFIGLVITAITQSSHATLTLAISALTVNQIDYMTAVGIAIGAAVGSTIFTVIGSLTANIEGKKIAAIHVFFKLLCAAVAIPFVYQYLALTDVIAARLDIAPEDYVYKLAIFMTLFNLFGVVVLTPFIRQISAVLNRVVVSRDPEDEADKPRFLSESAIEYAETALETISRETLHLLGNSMDIVSSAVSVAPEKMHSRKPAHVIVEEDREPLEIDFETLYQQKFKVLYSEIIDYAVRSSNAQGMTPQILSGLMETRRACIIMAAAVKKSEQLHVNIVQYGFCGNEDICAQYDHIRRNIIRLNRLVRALLLAKDPIEREAVREKLKRHKNKFDALSSITLDNLIRSGRITHAEATSIMNDNALARSITKNFNHIANILSTKTIVIDDF